MGCLKVIVRHLVGLCAFFTWLIGCVVIAVCLWVVATSSHFKQLLDGKLPVTYFALGMGGLLFLNGLLGWMGSSKRNRIMLKLFLVLSFLIILAEIGAIVTISILKSNSSELIDQSWKEMNQKSKSLIQEQLVCCSLSGPGELAPSEIDASCYHRDPLSSIQNNDARILNQSSCRESIQNWFHDNRYLILAVFAGIFSYQIITMLLTSSAISYARKRHDSLEELDSGSHHHHHGATYM